MDIPERENYLVIGFPKCGTSSLVKYLREKFPKSTVQHSELIYSSEIIRKKDAPLSIGEFTGVAQYLAHNKGFTPVIITRDPAERIWSGYNFFKLDKLMDFGEFLRNKDPLLHNVGFNDPIHSCNYKFWIEPWLQFDPIIVKLEDFKKDKDFPMEMVTEYVKGIEIESIPYEYQDMVDHAMKEYVELKQQNSSKKPEEFIIPHSANNSIAPDWSRYNYL